MSFIEENSALAGNLMLAGQIGLNNLRQSAAVQQADQAGAAWIRYLTNEVAKRNAVIAQLKAEVADERSRRLQAHAALRQLLGR